MADRSRTHPVALLDEMISRLDAHAAKHPEREGALLEAEQIVCEVVRDAAIADGTAAQTRLADTLLGNGLRGTP